jgi:hypothetical protein
LMPNKASKGMRFKEMWFDTLHTLRYNDLAVLPIHVEHRTIPPAKSLDESGQRARVVERQTHRT